jgi:hypothetical protein
VAYKIHFETTLTGQNTPRLWTATDYHLPTSAEAATTSSRQQEFI